MKKKTGPESYSKMKLEARVDEMRKDSKSVDAFKTGARQESREDGSLMSMQGGSVVSIKRYPGTHDHETRVPD